MTQERPCPSKAYRILVDETLNRQLTDWYGDLAVIPQENGTTVLIGSFTDQPALRGFLDHLWNLNLTVICVERIENEN